MTVLFIVYNVQHASLFSVDNILLVCKAICISLVVTNTLRYLFRRDDLSLQAVWDHHNLTSRRTGDLSAFLYTSSWR